MDKNLVELSNSTPKGEIKLNDKRFRTLFVLGILFEVCLLSTPATAQDPAKYG